jgi:hypothetical protein
MKGLLSEFKTRMSNFGSFFEAAAEKTRKMPFLLELHTMEPYHPKVHQLLQKSHL